MLVFRLLYTTSSSAPIRHTLRHRLGLMCANRTRKDLICMKKGPSTDEAMAAVCRNLPPPELSGPRTEAGKAVARLNSLKHGLSVQGFLPCKKSRCLFIDLCYLDHSNEGRAVLEDLVYGADCPLESIYYHDLVIRLTNDGMPYTLAHAWAMNEVRVARRQKLSAVEPDLLREVPVPGTGTMRTEEAVAMRYAERLHRERQALLAGILLNGEGVSSCKVASESTIQGSH